MYLERRPITLGEFNHCIYCFRGSRAIDPCGTNLSIDHMIPRIAGKEHPYLLTRVLRSEKHEDFQNLIDDRCNLRVICREDHNLFDNYAHGKSKSYQVAGLVGVVHQLVNESLPLGELERTTFLWQRQELFRLLQYRLAATLDNESSGAITERQRIHYTDTLGIVNLSLARWRSGRFDTGTYIPPLARFDQLRKRLSRQSFTPTLGNCARIKGEFDSFAQS